MLRNDILDRRFLGNMGSTTDFYDDIIFACLPLLHSPRKMTVLLAVIFSKLKLKNKYLLNK